MVLCVRCKIRIPQLFIEYSKPPQYYRRRYRAQSVTDYGFSSAMGSCHHCNFAIYNSSLLEPVNLSLLV